MALRPWLHPELPEALRARFCGRRGVDEGGTWAGLHVPGGVRRFRSPHTPDRY